VKTNHAIAPAARRRPFSRIVLAFPLMAGLMIGGCADLHETVRTGDLRTARTMLNAGAAADATDPAGATPLMIAARMGDARLATLLLKHGADIDHQNRAGQSALSLAWEHGRELTFRMLLDRGAAVHFDADVDRLPPKDRRRGLWKMAEEERLFRKIAARGADAPPERFDDYFARFPDGRRREEVLEMLTEAARKELAALGNPPDAEKAAAFLRNYGAPGGDAFEVTASNLNIRAEPTTRAQIVGRYAQGEAVRARETGPDWLRTDRGWISRAHVRPTSRIAPELGAPLQAVRAAARGRSSSGSGAGAEPPKSRAVKTDRRQREGEGGSSVSGKAAVSEGPAKETASADPGERRRAERQLATVMERPTLKGLEVFILAYKDRSPFDDLVGRARNAYRKLLLEEVAP